MSQFEVEERGNTGNAAVLAPTLSNLSTSSIKSTRSQNRVQVPKFLVKTFDILEDGKYDEYVSWNEKGDALVVKQVHGFTEVVLPTFFKHSNFASFVRQLNMYGFRRTDDKEITFKQPHFQRGKRDKLALIKRKVTSKQAATANNEKEIRALLTEVKRLKHSQEKYDRQIYDLKNINSNLERENAVMWEALNQAKARQNLLASKMQKIMLFLYKAYRKPRHNLTYGEGGGVPQLTDRSIHVDPEINGDAVEQAESLISGLESSDRLLKSIDNNNDNGKAIQDKPAGPIITEISPPGPIVAEPESTSNIAAKVEPLDERALSLVPLDSTSSEPLVKSQYFQDLGSLLKDTSDERREKYIGIAKEMNQHLLDQNNTLQRLNTVESMLDDPLDNFLDYTTPDQIHSILDNADDEPASEEEVNHGTKRKRQSKETRKSKRAKKQ